MTDELDELTRQIGGGAPYDVLRFALERFGDGLRIACSLGVEDMVVIHEAARAGKDLGVKPRVFLLDTGRLHQESYDLADRVRSRYDVVFEMYAPDTAQVEELVRTKGWNSFYESVDARKECCDIRKVQPLRRALSGASAWATGMRREQSVTRSNLGVVERDTTHDASGAPRPLWKLNPLASWTERQTWAFVEEHGVPTHALHRAGFPSIGCAPCTRAVAPGEDVRAGRWWWEDPSNKECGLHPRRSA